MERLRQLSNPAFNIEVQDTFPHLIGGDFNVTSWQAQFAEWVQEAGAMELLDPEIPTNALGSALDKFQFVPGFYVPSTFLPPRAGGPHEEEGMLDSPYYPASVLG